MKNLLILFTTLIICLFIPKQTSATHYLGQELTYTCIGPNTYHIMLKVYRDCAGIGLNNSQSMTYKSDSLGVYGTTSLTRTGITDVPAVCNSTLNCGTGNMGGTGIEQHIYEGMLTLPPGGPDWKLGVTVCCRTMGLTVVSTNVSAYTQTFLDNTFVFGNNSPVFLNTPDFYGEVGQSYNYAPLMAEIDGDSLAFSLVDAMRSVSTILPYLPGYDGQNFLGPTVPITINPETGEIRFTPISPEVTVIAVRVEEFRNGVKIGEITRDYQFTAMLTANNSPLMTGMDSTSRQDTTICLFEPISFDVFVNDVDSTDTLSIFSELSWYLANSGATLTIDSSSSPIKVTFSWIPTVGGVHHLIIGTRDNVCPIPGTKSRAFTIRANDNPIDCPCLGLADSVTVGMLPDCQQSGEAFVDTAGIPGFNFLWNTGATSPIITGLQSDWYQVEVSHSGGCVLNFPVRVDPDTSCYVHVTGTAYNNLDTLCVPTFDYLSYWLVSLTSATDTFYTFTDFNGHYGFLVQDTSDLIVEIHRPTGTTHTYLCPSDGKDTIVSPLIGNSYTEDFYLMDTASWFDLGVDLWGGGQIFPGQRNSVTIRYSNALSATAPISGTIVYAWDPVLWHDYQLLNLSLADGVTALDTINGTLTITYNNLDPGESRIAQFCFLTDTTATIGDTIFHETTIYPEVDAYPYNNHREVNTIVGNSYDPNDKRVWPHHDGNAWDGGRLDISETQLEYKIRFQNTGTAPAHRVVVRDTLSGHLDLLSIANIQTSHDCKLTVEENNILVFTFNNINLPDSASDPLGSQGFIEFGIQRDPNLAVGTEIKNQVAIYFDFNDPIYTNTTTTTIGIKLIADLPKIDNEIKTVAYPNPFSESIIIEVLGAENEKLTLQIYDALGRQLHQSQSTNGRFELQQLDLPQGIYYYQIGSRDRLIGTGKVIRN